MSKVRTVKWRHKGMSRASAFLVVGGFPPRSLPVLTPEFARIGDFNFHYGRAGDAR